MSPASKRWSPKQRDEESWDVTQSDGGGGYLRAGSLSMAVEAARALNLATALPAVRETIADTIEDYAHMCDEDDPESEGVKLLRRLRTALSALDAAGGAA